MTPAARVAAAIAVLDAWAAGTEGADRVLAAWGRASRYAGAKDRRAVADLVHGALRRLRSALWVAGWPGNGDRDADAGGAPGGEAAGPARLPPTHPAAPGRLALLGLLRLDGVAEAEIFTGIGHAPAPLAAAVARPLAAAPPAVRADLPDWLWPMLAPLGPAALEPLRRRAPLHLRANRLRTDRDGAAAALAEEGIATVPGPLSPACLTVTDGAAGVERSAAFGEGLVEVQDAASQALADLCAARPGEVVLDLCAGGGGKTLALAAAMGNRGRLVAHDIAPARLAQLPPRAARAGARVETRAPGALDDLAGACDLVLVDAPCSGSGAWARNADARWRLTPERLAELTAAQDALLAQAAGLVRPGGRIVHGTCSLLEIENGARVADFLARHPGFRREDERRWTPADGGDGFYGCVLRRAG